MVFMIRRIYCINCTDSAYRHTAVLYIANATLAIISNTEISHAGSFGVWIKEGTKDIAIFNSLVIWIRVLTVFESVK